MILVYFVTRFNYFINNISVLTSCFDVLFVSMTWVSNNVNPTQTRHTTRGLLDNVSEDGPFVIKLFMSV